jgi:hypothetical protein
MEFLEKRFEVQSTLAHKPGESILSADGYVTAVSMGL